MKSFFVLLFLFHTSLWAQAASDSVAFFFTPEKAVVLVKEQGSQGRLQALMAAFNAGSNLQGQNEDKSLRISCMRNPNEATCTFGFAPSSFSQFGDKTLDATLSLQELNLPDSDDFEMGFESSRGHRFDLKIESGIMILKASKPGA